MREPGSSVVPFAAFVAYRERRRHAAAAAPRAAQRDSSVQNPAGAPEARSVAPAAADCAVRDESRCDGERPPVSDRPAADGPVGGPRTEATPADGAAEIARRP